MKKEGNEMRVAIIGTRDSGDLTVEQIIPYIPQNCSEIISGGAQGVDRLAEEAAARLNIPMKIILPDYETYGRTAPLERNKLIVERAALVLAFWDVQSRGSANTLAYCVQTHTPFKIITLDSPQSKRGK